MTYLKQLIRNAVKRLESVKKQTGETGSAPVKTVEAKVCGPIVIVWSIEDAIAILCGMLYASLIVKLMEMVKDSSVTQEVKLFCEQLAAGNNIVGLILEMAKIQELREKLQEYAA